MTRLDTSFVKLPIVCVTPAVSVVGYVNVLSSTTPETRNDPLYPLSNTPAVVPVLSVTFLTNILSPTLRS